ncbi:hypothetical protein I7I53_05208 [Histoplasma capsulatum var. duboisii H88]|uniref:Uncharacterized protein n=1 Tax=Ajellomyces capsulatus (strain H88) TaxID=544711 RepID=A0A8A1LUB6_AJEC8|nr:hypothetical protein I7I53_05208 [Histoplasma capsulatum var. duboisii H88]
MKKEREREPHFKSIETGGLPTITPFEFSGLVLYLCIYISAISNDGSKTSTSSPQNDCGRAFGVSQPSACAN